MCVGTHPPSRLVDYSLCSVVNDCTVWVCQDSLSLFSECGDNRSLCDELVIMDDTALSLVETCVSNSVIVKLV